MDSNIINSIILALILGYFVDHICKQKNLIIINKT